MTSLPAVEMPLCLALNRWGARSLVHGFFATISRLGDGVFWYALMASLALAGGMRGAMAALHLAITCKKSGHAGRRDRDRQRHGFAEQCGRDRNLRDVDQHALAQLDGVEVGAVGGERQLVIGAALAIVEQRARQAPPRDLAQVLDIGDRAHVVTMLT
mgnify:CR=1 FL=1